VAKKRGKSKIKLLKRAIETIAKKKGFSRFQFYRITDGEIWDWLIDSGHSGRFSFTEIFKKRKRLPKQYHTKYWE